MNVISGIWQLITRCYNWTRQNDTPNLVIFLFTFVFWPVIIYYINKKVVIRVPNLLVSIFKTKITMNNKSYEAIDFIFKNRTGKVVYLTNARLRLCSKKFIVHQDASRDIITCSHELKFKDDTGKQFNKEQVTLNTGEEAITCIATSSFEESLFNYNSSLIRKLFGWRKYFR